jgi:hypothetical protein
VGPLAELLSLNPDQSIESQLAASAITAADLTLALLAVVAPYGQMFSQLLKLFARAQANTGGSELVVCRSNTRLSA